MPKVDLHRHLEGSLRLDTLVEIAQEFKLDVPASNMEELRPLVQMDDEPPSWQAFLSKFETLRLFYQSPEVIQRLVVEAIADAAHDNVRYLELRYSPQALASARGFSFSEVMDYVCAAAAEARRAFEIEVGLIVTLVRHEPVATAENVAAEAFARMDRGIVGLDLAGDEVNYRAAPFREIFEEAGRLGMGVTIHAGEWLGAESVRSAVDLGAERIGHGVRVIEDPDVLALVRERGTALEISISSNVQSGVVSGASAHPLSALAEKGVRVTMNTDDPSIVGCTLTDEYYLAVRELGLGYADLRRLTMNAVNSAFLPPDSRRRLARQMCAQLPSELSAPLPVPEAFS